MPEVLRSVADALPSKPERVRAFQVKGRAPTCRLRWDETCHLLVGAALGLTAEEAERLASAHWA